MIIFFFQIYFCPVLLCCVIKTKQTYIHFKKKKKFLFFLVFFCSIKFVLLGPSKYLNFVCFFLLLLYSEYKNMCGFCLLILCKWRWFFSFVYLYEGVHTHSFQENDIRENTLRIFFV